MRVVNDTRPFLESYEGMAYSYKSILGIENVTQSPRARILEFKELSSYDKIPFINKARSFIIGCINGRVKGTIFFGVADNQKGNLLHLNFF